MEQFNNQSTYVKHASNLSKGFTIVELMVTIAIAAIVSAIALPSLSSFLVQMRVNNEVTEMQRLLLTARNNAINTGLNTTVCPLDSHNTCTNNWQDTISVFSNTLGTTNIMDGTDILIKIKAAIKDTDELVFSNATPIIYTPAGRTVTNTASTFTYCPKESSVESNGINVSTSGRTYIGTQNASGQYIDRNSNVFTCP